jgi:hypothetical protein
VDKKEGIVTASTSVEMWQIKHRTVLISSAGLRNVLKADLKNLP